MPEDAVRAWEHGVQGYTYRRCRCAVCCEEHTRERRRYKWQKLKRMVNDGTIVYKNVGGESRRVNTDPACPHGTDSAYQYWWCQCGICTAKHTARCSDRKKRVKMRLNDLAERTQKDVAD